MSNKTIAESGKYDELVGAGRGFTNLMEAHRAREKVTDDAQVGYPSLND